MTVHDFIFSNQSPHKWTRHIALWLSWWFVFFLIFHIPLHAIHGWDMGSKNANLSEGITVGWIMKMLFFNCLLAVVVPQMIFVYTVVYFILPVFFYKRKNIAVTVVSLVAIFSLLFFIAVTFKSLAVLPNYLMGKMKRFPPPVEFLSYSVVRDCIGSLPIILSLALLIKLVKRWRLKEAATAKLANEKVQAELQLLKSQVHPHFLFNTLNNIYYFTLNGAEKASLMLQKLSGILDYITTDCNQPLVRLEDEIRLIEDYISLESMRYDAGIKLDMELPGSISDQMIAPLLLIPFVENGFKHGASKLLHEHSIKVYINVEDDILHFLMNNKRPPANGNSNSKGRIGLKNVIKRLDLMYPGSHELQIDPGQEMFTVDLLIHLKKGNLINRRNHEKSQLKEYALD